MPEWRAGIDARLAALGVSPTRRADILAEIGLHLQDRYDELRDAGHADDEARRIAEMDLETDRLLRELARVERRAPLDPPVLGNARHTVMSTLWQDLKYAARSLRLNPAYTSIVIATLTLGIGANAAIFSVADAVMLRPFPFPDVDRIVVLNETTRREQQTMSVAWPTFQDWKAQNQSFEHLGIYRNTVAILTGGDRPERLLGAIASSGVFGAMGVTPIAGRVFTAADDHPDAAKSVVISERLWRGRFDADPSILGRAIVLNNEPHVIVGIMPPAMRFPQRTTDVWLPLGPIISTFPPRGAHPGLFAVGKLKPGVSFAQAVSDMDTIARRLATQYPDSNRDVAVAMMLYYEQVVRNIRPTLYVLMGAVAFVLLIGCANLANLMLARAERRQREIAVRSALGAERRRIIQQLLTEAVLLSAIGGALGLLLATWIVKLFVASRPVTIPRIDLVGVDGRVIAFAAALSIVTGVVFGLVPALRASSPDMLSSLKQGGRGGAAPSRRFRSALVVVEVALALVLLVGAGLMIRSFARLMGIDPGFEADGVVTMRLTLPAAKYGDTARWIAFHDDLIHRVSAITGITAAGLNSAVPLEGGGSESPIVVEGRPMPAPDAPGTMCLFQATSPDYLKAMGIPILRGRAFTDQDRQTAPPVVIVDETVARRLFPGEDPLGKRIAFEFSGHDRRGQNPIWREIVGIVKHVRHYGIASEPPYVQVYAPVDQLPLWFQQRHPAMSLFARTSLGTEGTAAAIRRELAAIDRDIPVYSVQTMSAYLAQDTEQPRLSVMLLSGLGGLALLLAVIGIYGVVSYSVAQRTQEIGVRMALGATGRDVLRLVVGQAIALVVAGVAIGVGASLALGSVMRNLLFEVSAHDPSTLVAIAAVLTAVGITASAVPAMRATRVDPLVALRAE
ncbi:MAG TPA: ABC transporter permease [Vicinamibacterales bacterium]|nr:ABC transporter permease [Vicinamibacterales bacterium]